MDKLVCYFTAAGCFGLGLSALSAHQWFYAIGLFSSVAAWLLLAKIGTSNNQGGAV